MQTDSLAQNDNKCLINLWHVLENTLKRYGYSSFEEWSRSWQFGKNTSEIVERLSLHNLKLKNIPPEIGSFNSLTVLNLANNKLASLPPETGRLSSLEILILSKNRLTTLPIEIVNLSYLRRLYANENQLTYLPFELEKLPLLCTLEVSENFLLDKIQLPPGRRHTLIVQYNQRIPDRLPSQYPFLDQQPSLDFCITFRDETQIMINSEFIATRWRYMKLMLDVNSFEVQNKILDLSHLMSIRVGQCLVEMFYGQQIEVSRLSLQDCEDLLACSDQIYIDQSNLILKYCKLKTQGPFELSWQYKHVK